jgi:hypothetical protein
VYQPVFTQPPQSWRDWWSAVRQFAAGWYGIAAGEVQGYDREVDRLGRQLGMPLSPSIHEWAAFATDLQHAGIFGRAFNGDSFTLGWDSDMQAVTLLTLLEGDVCWGAHQAHLGRDDPPVDLWHPARIGGHWDWWRGFTPTTSQFALQYLIAHLVYPGNPAAGGFTTTVPPASEIAGQLRGIGRTSIDLGGEVLIEDDDLVVLAGTSVWAPPGEETGTITVRAAIGASRIDSVPQLLVDLARRGGGWSHGAFTDLLHR